MSVPHSNIEQGTTLMIDHRLGCWSNINKILDQRLVLLGYRLVRIRIGCDTAVQGQKAVTPYFSSKQLLHYDL